MEINYLLIRLNYIALYKDQRN